MVRVMRRKRDVVKVNEMKSDGGRDEEEEGRRGVVANACRVPSSCLPSFLPAAYLPAWTRGIPL